ncbi:MAG: LytR/AlgR family response regulator transcription factor [Acutalibacteraceae bacterium]|jgi:two-component system response regulator LytT
MRAAVCTDNPLSRQRLTEYLVGLNKKQTARCATVSFEDCRQLLYALEDGAMFDLVVIDRGADETASLNVIRRLTRSGFAGEILFMDQSGVVQVSIRKQALLPPRSPALRAVAADEACYTFCSRRRTVQIPYREIVYVECEDSRCVLHRQTGEHYPLSHSLRAVEEELADDRFLRCHQSFLINMEHVHHMDESFEMSNGDRVLVRQRQFKSIQSAVTAFIRRRHVSFCGKEDAL